MNHRECNWCGGTGEDEIGEPCRNCNGAGEVEDLCLSCGDNTASCRCPEDDWDPEEYL